MSAAKTLVYRVAHDDAEDRIVEAPDYSSAIIAWRKALIAEWVESGDWDPADPENVDDEVQPRSVELIADEPVIHYREAGS